jgi:MFS family permease
VAGVSYANEISPEGMKSTAQGLFGAMVSGFGAAVGGFAGGLLIEAIGGRWLFLSAGVFVLASTLLITLARRSRHIPQTQVVK